MTAQDAALIRNERCVSKKQAIHELIVILQKKIKLAAAHGLNDITWHIPRIGANRPWYDPKEIMQLMQKHCERQHFYARVLNSRVLYVSWRYTE
jgi:hypothetical protein